MPEEHTRWDGWLAPRIWLPAAIILVGALVVAAVLLAVRWDNGEADSAANLRPPQHVHADFSLVVRGQRFDFNKPEFVSTEEKHLSEDVHIHAPRYTVVHSHRFGVTWDEFFRSLGFRLSDPTNGARDTQVCMTFPDGTKLCNSDRETWKFVVNGVRIDGVANLDIQDLNRVLISYGSEDDTALIAQYAKVSDEACIPSEVCISRGTDTSEACGKSDTTCTR
ncbi:MAG: hypothetical protein FJ317_08985 [SAR202 cluster bacterium]|nr:hypothetical protein [SAR202 cluster bacterium]